jgi:hypothetical protein
MNVERYLRLIVGLFVMATLALGYWVSPYWFLCSLQMRRDLGSAALAVVF